MGMRTGVRSRKGVNGNAQMEGKGTGTLNRDCKQQNQHITDSKHDSHM